MFDPPPSHLDPQAPLGIFDSGVGGLSVLRAVHQELPPEGVLYFADQGHVPYGPRPLEEVRAFSEEITRFLLRQGAKLIVVACNTASAAALHHLRATFPQVQFVGMEPAVKPAAEGTLTGVVGVLATPATFQGALYASVIERFAKGVKVLQHTCPGLVAQIEAGALTAPATRAILEEALHPMLAQNIDTVVLGCTHYPFVIPLIQEITGPGVRVIDPAPAIARQVRRVLSERGGLASPKSLEGKVDASTAGAIVDYAQDNTRSAPPSLRFFTTGNPTALARLLPTLFGQPGQVESCEWQAGHIRCN